jgi:hypothetical protein
MASTIFTQPTLEQCSLEHIIIIIVWNTIHNISYYDLDDRISGPVLSSSSSASTTTTTTTTPTSFIPS